MQNESSPASVNVDAFVQQFIISKPRTKDPAERIRKWIDVANDPVTPQKKRQQARQNVRRLARRYPAIIQRMMQAPVSQEAA